MATDPMVFLAPMAGITDLPYRTLVQEFGADRVVSEMVASQEMVQAKPGVREKAELGLAVSGTAVQLAGRDATWMARAAKLIEDQGATIIDINMGCPAKKVTGGLSGSALMKTPDHALSLIEAVVGAVKVPVTLKMRLGWDDSCHNAASIAARAEAAGIRLVTIHGRTRCQFYTGSADWAAIAEVKQSVKIPVIANGDIVDLASAREALRQSGADGVMIGRGAYGRPWAPAQIRAGLLGHEIPEAPTGAALTNLVLRHQALVLEFYGAQLGLKTFRKHLGWYFDGGGVDPVMRRKVLTESDPERVAEMIPEAFAAARQIAA